MTIRVLAGAPPPCALGLDLSIAAAELDYVRIVARRARVLTACIKQDYVATATWVCEAVLSNNNAVGILVGRTGLGIAMAANKIRGIRAVRCLSVEDARTARTVFAANVLCLSGARGVSINAETIGAFLATAANRSA